MTLLVTLSAIAGALVAIVGLVKVVIPVSRAVVSFFREVITFLHIFNGRGEFVDEVTGKKVEEVPPLGLVLAGIRTEQNKQGEQISALTSVVQQVADQQGQINALTIRADGHDTAISQLIATTFDRGAQANLHAEQIKQGGSS